MPQSVIQKKALIRIKKIHRLSQRYNKKVRYSHRKRLLELMASHVKEIRQLVRQKNKHYLVETGDLMILCFEMLLEDKASADRILRKCFGRYEQKLTMLIDELSLRKE
jgi:hypothetical protein